MNHGLRTTGTVTNKKEWHGSTGGMDPMPIDGYYAIYTFVAQDGTQVNNACEFPSSWYNKMEIGTRIEIAFDSADPKRSLPIGGIAKIQSLWWIIFSTVWLAGATFGASLGLDVLFADMLLGK